MSLCKGNWGSEAGVLTAARDAVPFPYLQSVQRSFLKAEAESLSPGPGSQPSLVAGWRMFCEHCWLCWLWKVRDRPREGSLQLQHQEPMTSGGCRGECFCLLLTSRACPEPVLEARVLGALLCPSQYQRSLQNPLAS